MVQVQLDQCIAPSFYDLHHDLKEDRYSEYWLKGGRGSTKSSFISVEIVLGMLQDPDTNAVAFRRYGNELRDTVYGQFEWAIRMLGVEDEFTFMYSPMQIVRNSTGQKIVFKAADNPRKIKSIQLGRGYIKYVWFEECDQFNGMRDIRNILQSVLRGVNRQRISFFSFNPPESPRAWTNAETKLTKPGRRIHHSTYLAVPREWLGDVFLAEAEHLEKTNNTAYRHEYLGEEVGTGLEVFNNVILREITPEERAMFDNIRQGIDFGYAADPVAFVRKHYDSTRRKLYFLNEFTGINISNRKLFEETKVYHDILATCDSAEPKSIAELHSYGMKVRGAKKGPDSVEYGIKFMQDMEQIVIDPNTCPLAAKEFMTYALKRGRDGEIINQFPDKDNHTIDAARYGLEADMRTRKQERRDSRRLLF